MDLRPGQTVRPSIADHVQNQVRNEDQKVYSVKALWYLDFFPDEIIIKEKTITLRRNYFIYKYIETIPIDSIGETNVLDSFFSASITIRSKIHDKSFEIKGLPTEKAHKAKTIIDGLLMRTSNNQNSNIF